MIEKLKELHTLVLETYPNINWAVAQVDHTGALEVYYYDKRVRRYTIYSSTDRDFDAARAKILAHTPPSPRELATEALRNAGLDPEELLA